MTKLQGANGSDYDARIKDLKRLHTNIIPEYIDALAHIQNLTSDNLHEHSWHRWDSPTINWLVTMLIEVLNEIYVIPARKKEAADNIQQLHQFIIGRDKPAGE